MAMVYYHINYIIYKPSMFILGKPPYYLVITKGLEENSSTARLFNIAMENEPFIDDVPIKGDDFPWLC